jgi:DNA-binding CsgD family transcriptional regulator/tetratricopeptide (TPR) repeat protein
MFYQEMEMDKIVFGKIVKGTIFTHVSEYPQALKEYYSALDLSRGDTTKMISLHINLGAVFARMKNRESSLYHYRIGLELNPKSETQLASLYNNIADCYYDKGKEDSTLLFMNRAQLIFEKNKNRQELFSSKIRTCKYLMDFNQEGNAHDLFKTIDTTGLNSKEKLMWFTMSYKIGMPEVELNGLINKFEGIKELIEDELYLEVSKLLSDKSYSIGAVENAFKFNKLYSDRRDSILAQEKIVLGHKVQLNRIVTAKDKAIAEKEMANDKLRVSYQIEEEKRKKWRMTTLLSIALLLIILYSYNLVVKRKKEKLAFNEKELVNEKKQTGLLINKLERAKQLMNDKNMEIEMLLLNASKTNLDGASVEKMMTNLKEKNWSNFLSDFELIYPDFFNEITTHLSLPLSKNERRLCALIKLNLSNKEIAGYVFVSQESVKKSKNRLFKKFNGEKTGQEISDLLRNI